MIKFMQPLEKLVLLAICFLDDTTWFNTMEEATAFRLPRQLRQLFCVILTHCEASDPLALWNAFKEQMSQDHLRHMSAIAAEQATLAYIKTVVTRYGKSLQHFNLPALEEAPVEDIVDNPEPQVELDNIRQQLNIEQLRVASVVLEAVSNVADGSGQDQRIFITYNYIYHEIKR